MPLVGIEETAVVQPTTSPTTSPTASLSSMSTKPSGDRPVAFYPIFRSKLPAGLSHPPKPSPPIPPLFPGPPCQLVAQSRFTQTYTTKKKDKSSQTVYSPSLRSLVPRLGLTNRGHLPPSPPRRPPLYNLQTGPWKRAKGAAIVQDTASPSSFKMDPPREQNPFACFGPKIHPRPFLPPFGRQALEGTLINSLQLLILLLTMVLLLGQGPTLALASD